MKKCLAWINLLAVSRGKCNNSIKKGKFYRKLINNQQDIPYLAGPKPEGMPFSGMIKLKLKFFKSSTICRLCIYVYYVNYFIFIIYYHDGWFTGL